MSGVLLEPAEVLLRTLTDIARSNEEPWRLLTRPPTTLWPICKSSVSRRLAHCSHAEHESGPGKAQFRKSFHGRERHR
jgi:hypothetical protein